jgi:hypothetical protein
MGAKKIILLEFPFPNPMLWLIEDKKERNMRESNKRRSCKDCSHYFVGVAIKVGYGVV